MIFFNDPYITGKEFSYIQQAIKSSKLSGNGEFTQKCHSFFETKYGFKRALLTTSCTDALEMAAILADIKPGDEVIIPSYTFVSSALAFVRQGAVIRFIDSRADHPGMDEKAIEQAITAKTKAIVVVHYAGVACDMDVIMDAAQRHNLLVIEDAAQAIDSFYKGKPLGSIGHFAAFSFHETKNITCGEGGLLAVNDERFVKRAEIIWEKGTNRAEFYRGEVNKYGWVDTGSSFLPSELNAAFLYAQLERLEDVQSKRVEIWNRYKRGLSQLDEKGYLRLPFLPEYASNNAHMFYVICRSLDERTALIEHLRNNGVMAVFHYLSLHSSPYYQGKHFGGSLSFSDKYSDTLLRLPLFYSLQEEEIDYICELIIHFFTIT